MSEQRDTKRTKKTYESAKTKMTEKKDAAKKFVYDKTPDRLKNASDLQVRFRTGFIYVTVSVLCVLASELSTVLLLCVLSGIVAYPLSVWQLGLAGALIVTGALLVALLVWYVFWMRARVGDVGVSFFGSAYTGLLLSSLIVVREAIPGLWGGVLVIGIFCSVWANDSFAYLVGRKFGKHKLAPRISPKKSWEGFVGGLVGSVVIWCLMTLIPGVNMGLVQAVPFGIVCGLFGVLGDLAESRIKRNSGVKDSGTIMPGHGGILDRCDSLFLASVAAAVMLVGAGCIPYAI